MFYETATNDHGLPHDPFKSCIVPRPIGWVSTVDGDGVVNLAPYSFFNGVASEPPMVMFASNGRQPHGVKDTVTNCESTGEFVCNLATWNLRGEMNQTSAPFSPEIDEIKAAGLGIGKSTLVKPPRVRDCPIHMECKHYKTIELPCDRDDQRNAIVIGEVVGIHIDDGILVDGKVDLTRCRPIARLGYMDYARVDYVFSMKRPTV